MELVGDLPGPLPLGPHPSRAHAGPHGLGPLRGLTRASLLQDGGPGGERKRVAGWGQGGGSLNLFLPKDPKTDALERNWPSERQRGSLVIGWKGLPERV